MSPSENNMPPKTAFFIALFFGLFCVSCNENNGNFTNQSRAVSIVRIPLNGVAAQPDAEFSGLSWFGNTLVLMPENPETFDDHHFFSIRKSAIDSFISHPNGPSPNISTIQLIGDFSRLVPGYEGFEALAFMGRRAFLTIEAHSDTGMTGWLISGEMSADGKALTLDTTRRTAIPVPGNIRNYAAEALTVYGNTLIAFYEANGKNVNSAPAAYRFDTQLNYLGKLPMPAIEYRVTDACNTNSAGGLWLMNYFYPREYRKLHPADDIFSQNGHTETEHPVERILHMTISNNRLKIADKSALNIAVTSVKGRNWEGLARLDNKGFLVVTDQYPETILAFVPFSNN